MRIHLHRNIFVIVCVCTCLYVTFVCARPILAHLITILASLILPFDSVTDSSSFVVFFCFSFSITFVFVCATWYPCSPPFPFPFPSPIVSFFSVYFLSVRVFFLLFFLFLHFHLSVLSHLLALVIIIVRSYLFIYLFLLYSLYKFFSINSFWKKERKEKFATTSFRFLLPSNSFRGRQFIIFKPAIFGVFARQKRNFWPAKFVRRYFVYSTCRMRYASSA